MDVVFLEGKIKNISIHFNGIKNQYSDEIIKYDYNNLTGCVSFIKINLMKYL